MGLIFRSIISILFLGAIWALGSCSSEVETSRNAEPPVAIIPRAAPPRPAPGSGIPNLQSEILDDRNKVTTSPIGNFDFKNFSFELPRGWENPDRSEIRLIDGRVAPVSIDIDDDMTGDEKAERKALRRIGLSYVTTKYLDLTGDDIHEAIVILKIETGGAAIPQVVYVYSWKDDKPELIWLFRTGDRADGGLKDLRPDSGNLVVELYGQDRFILGQTETGKVTGDEEQLCCPTFFTRSVYKWNGRNFLMQGKRLTFSVANPSAPPQENLGDKINAAAKPKK
ncbi:MAG: hypothetical protein ABIV48_01820 [Pyrinomonadaceae bacterium]